jgi:hypothetical protein
MATLTRIRIAAASILILIDGVATGTTLPQAPPAATWGGSISVDGFDDQGQLETIPDNVTTPGIKFIEVTTGNFFSLAYVQGAGVPSTFVYAYGDVSGNGSPADADASTYVDYYTDIRGPEDRMVTVHLLAYVYASSFPLDPLTADGDADAGLSIYATSGLLEYNASATDGAQYITINTSFSTETNTPFEVLMDASVGFTKGLDQKSGSAGGGAFADPCFCPSGASQFRLVKTDILLRRSARLKSACQRTSLLTHSDPR